MIDHFDRFVFAARLRSAIGMVGLNESERQIGVSRQKLLRFSDAANPVEPKIGDYLRCEGWINGRLGQTPPREAQSGATAILPKPPVTADEGWIEWTGGDRPHPPSTLVEVKHRNGQHDQGKSAFARWWHDPYDAGHDIIAYRLVTPAPPTGEGGGL